jgi:glycosyltransferase involved in cell wall biosynthesis
MASARLVVLPITPQIRGAGISVYVQAMALRKCVIISAGPAAEDVLTSGQAIIVPPSDPAALRQAIERAFTDPAYRSFRAQRVRVGYDTWRRGATVRIDPFPYPRGLRSFRPGALIGGPAEASTQSGAPIPRP